MRPEHPWRLAATVALAVVLVVGSYAAWLLWQVSSNLSAAADDAQELKAAIKAGDDARVDAAIDDLQQHASTSRDRTDSVVWSLLTLAPGFGDDVEGVRLVSEVIDDVSSGALGDLAHRAGDLDKIVPSQGGVDLAAVEGLQQPLVDGHAELAAAQQRLAGADPSGFVESLKLKYRDLHRQVREAASTLGAAADAVEVMPALLGADGPKKYLLVVQNNAEIRATGGLPGAVSLVEAEGGKLTMTKQVAGNSFERADEPVLPLTETELGLHSEIMGTFFLNANLTADFPRAAALWRARWTQVQGDQIDGVVSVDPVALSYLLRVTGPVQVDGARLDADNVVDQLLHRVYLQHEDPAAQDAYFRRVAQGVFTALTEGAPDPQALVSELRRGASESRLLVHSFDQAVQAELAGTAVSGELATQESESPQVGVYLNDATGAKMSYFLRYDVDVRSTYCTDDVQGLSGRMTISSTAPADAASLPAYVTGGGTYGVPPGMQVVAVHIYGPSGGTIDTLNANGKPDDFQLDFVDSGRPVKKTWVSLDPGQTVDLTWTMTSGPDQTGDGALAVTPTITPGDASAVLKTAC